MLFRSLAWVLPAVAVAACSGGTSTIGSGTSSGSSGDDGSSSGNGSSGASSGNGSSSGESSGNGSSGASSGSTPQATKTGTLTITSTHYKVGQTPIEMGSATGTFYELPPAPSGGASPCAVTKAGACTVTACTFGGAPTDAGTSNITYTDAGPVKVSGVLVNNGTMTMTPGGYGYQPVSGNVAFFNGGENVRFVAPGNPNGAPAFDVALVAPTSPNVTSPAFNAQSQVVVGSNQSLGVAWQNGGSGEVVVQLASGSQQKSAIARCAFPGPSGSGSIPSAAIQAVHGAGAQTSIIVSAEGNKVLTPDGWNITIALQAYGLRATPNGTSIASGVLVVQ